MIRVAYIATVGLLALVLVGCPGREDSSTRGATASQPTVKIKAFINVSSGCQVPTVDLLKKLEADHPGRVQLELIDFGDGGEGARAWQDSGYTCMTILLNGSPFVKYAAAGEEQTMAFQMPAGFLWMHEDLQAAVEAGLRGNLQAISEQEVLGEQSPSQIKAEVSVIEPADNGTTTASLAVNDRPVLTVQVAAGGISPVERVREAAKALQEWLGQPVNPSQLTVKQTEGGFAIMGADKTIITVTAEDATAAQTTPEKLAGQWQLSLKQALVTAAGAGPQGTAAAECE